MATSLVYRAAPAYELAMRILYGRHYRSRYTAIAELVEPGSSVLDLCCGPGILFARYLKDKSVRYTGLDLNSRFISQLSRRGGNGEVRDLRSEEPLPPADYCIMQASLYHFLPNPGPIVDRMLTAARRQAIIAEPIRNLTGSSLRLVSLASRLLTDPGDGNQPHRFNETTLDSFFAEYGRVLNRSFLIPGGREKVYVLDA